MIKDEALHKALKVLNCLNNDRVYETAWVKGAINACEEALELSAQEPVAWEYAGTIWHDKDEVFGWHEKHKLEEAPPLELYTHPHQWQGLSDAENEAIIQSIWEWGNDFPYDEYRICIEQALKEKNHGI
jgi:hypothetical protein